MKNSAFLEIELYEPMRIWLQRYLEDKYKNAEIITIDSHSKTLDTYLEEYGVLSYYPESVGVDIQIDVLGIIKEKNRVFLVFIEAKKNQLNLHDLGQLWAYCQLCEPIEAFLLSPKGLGSLNKIFNNLSRIDLLEFGNEGKKIKKMQVGKWDILGESIDYVSLIPKI